MKHIEFRCILDMLLCSLNLNDIFVKTYNTTFSFNNTELEWLIFKKKNRFFKESTVRLTCVMEFYFWPQLRVILFQIVHS